MPWKEIALAAVLAALAFLGWEFRNLGAERDVAAIQAAQARSSEAATKLARAREHAAAASDAAASAQYQRELEDGKKDLDGAIHRLRAALRLRDQQLSSAGHLPTAAARAGRRDASAPADFLAAHGEDALRLAGEADDVARQLSACQAIVESDRAAQ
ncbi:hypothetical protein JFK97_05770 [Chromobacterium phragmitis]|uniref:hypothetical protein n=1 Tax=Chromobacterium amazonense TaxID=1382803 RepID=UPI0021B7E066|nr:hypothetical protein [Chromobacterium amazonense]MBM2883892.1 hypothetical protein [Chromobacterium amazonense]MDE1711809.1 hypothetical protein [Chromobacterium amazonense]